MYRRLFWGNREAFQPQTISETIESDQHRYQVIHIPGHAEDHIVLLDQEHGRLFSGDLFLTSRPRVMLRYESLYQRGMSEKQICKTLYPKVDPLTYVSIFEMSPHNIVHSIIRNQ
ncbi:MBL fold metallo-hydrolase [Brevibacillus sp. SYSU BS000544]|uniref:MBL fold metallo-hydrolase n=1 Tax=Brevibacillus sp. SYSU BS000544 TaxID=3416443 RepID=UPI003CE5AE30